MNWFWRVLETIVVWSALLFAVLVAAYLVIVFIYVATL